MSDEKAVSRKVESGESEVKPVDLADDYVKELIRLYEGQDEATRKKALMLLRRSGAKNG